MCILGIDPGLSGALAYLDDELLIYDIPTLNIERNGKNKRQIDIHSLHAMLGVYNVQHCYLENINAFPGQGVTSMFQMGRGYGQIEMALASHKIPVTYIAPQVWKKALGVPKDKDGARQRASQLMPAESHQWSLKKHDGRAEAALIALYGKNKTTA